MRMYWKISLWCISSIITAILLNFAGPMKGWLSPSQKASYANQNNNAATLSNSESAENSSSNADSGNTEPGSEEESKDSTSTLANIDEGKANRSSAVAGSRTVTHGENDKQTSKEKESTNRLQKAGRTIQKEETKFEQSPSKSRLQRIYERLCDIHRERLETPVVGKRYSVKCANGDTMSGVLVEKNRGMITLRVRRGRISLPIQSVSERQRSTFFPDRVAQIRALRDLKRTASGLKEIASTRGTQHPDEDNNKDSIKETSADTGKTAAGKPEKNEDKIGIKSSVGGQQNTRRSVDFDTDPAKTPDRIKPVLQKFAGWLENQARRAGGAIGKRAYAKKHRSQAVVLYLVMAPSFQKQDYGLRFQYAEGIWKFWGFRCYQAGLVPHPRRAYVVMLDKDGRIIGGSREEQSNDVWVEKTEQLKNNG